MLVCAYVTVGTRVTVEKHVKFNVTQQTGHLTGVIRATKMKREHVCGAIEPYILLLPKSD